MSKQVVYVIMCNDYPDCVISTEDGADDYVKARIAVERALKPRGPRIHWRWYKFTLNKLGGVS